MKRIAIHFYIDDKYYKDYEDALADFEKILLENCEVGADGLAVYEYNVEE